MMASILKSKGVPCRVRSGNSPSFKDGKSDDHWINQYWGENENHWITIDVDGSLSLKSDSFDPYDMPNERFDFPADAWLNIRAGKDDPNRFWNAKPETGMIVVLWSLFYDFHCLMNDEVIYVHTPKISTYEVFVNLTEMEKEKIDNLARLMQEPDKNFDELQRIWETEKDFRLLAGGLL